MNIESLYYLYAGVCASLVVWFSIIWLFAKKIDNWSVVDAAWAISPALFSAIPVFFWGGFRSFIVWGFIAFWGLRLAVHLHLRVGGGREREDSRYADMRNRWGDQAPIKMFWFFQIQAATTWILTIPVFLTFLDCGLPLGFLESAGIATAIVALLGEIFSDLQLKQFKAIPLNKGRVCRSGFWAYSRHPNYFFEWLFWVGVSELVFFMPYGWLAIFVPIMMYSLLRYASGVPLAEARARINKGADWADYERNVPVFFPSLRRYKNQPDRFTP